MKVLKTTSKTSVHEMIDYRVEFDGVKATISELLIDGVRSNIRFKVSKNKDFNPIIIKKGFDFSKAEFFDLYKESDELLKSFPDIADDCDLYFMYSAGNMLFDKHFNAISLPLRFNYIGSLDERYDEDAEFDQLIKLLEKHEFVQELEVERIPYYNSDFSGQKGIEACTVYLSNEKYNMIYQAVKDEKYFFTNLKDYIVFGSVYAQKPLNVYGEEITKLLQEFHGAE